MKNNIQTKYILKEDAFDKFTELLQSSPPDANVVLQELLSRPSRWSGSSATQDVEQVVDTP